MDSFERTREIERIGHAMFLPMLQQYDGGQVRLFSNSGPQAIDLQALGDGVITNGVTRVFEAKCEVTETGNLAFEIFSSKARRTPGWFTKICADVLIYGFIRTGNLFVFDVAPLVQWSVNEPEKPPRIPGSYRWFFQKKHPQRNDTAGVLVPIADLQDADLIRASLTASPDAIATAARELDKLDHPKESVKERIKREAEARKAALVQANGKDHSDVL